MEFNGVFANNEWKIIPYCIYHNCEVIVVLDNDGNCALSYDEYRKEYSAMFYLSGEKIQKHVPTITLTMHEFLEMAAKTKANYIDICNTSCCYISQYDLTDCKQYMKENFDNYLKNNPKEKPNYYFLYQDNIIAKTEGELNVVNLDDIDDIIDDEIKRFAYGLCKKLNIKSYDELEELVKLGKTLKNN